MKGLIRTLSRGPEADQKTVKKHILISTSFDITGVADTVDWATVQIGPLPEGNILLLGAVARIQVDGGADAHIIDNWDGDYAIGTAPTADEALAGEELNIIPSTAISAAADDKLAPYTRATTTATEQVIIDNTAGAMEINLNLLIDDNVITDAEDGTFAVAGTLDIAYIVLGDD